MNMNMNNSLNSDQPGSRRNRFRDFLSVEKESVSNAEKLVATIGGLVGISIVAVFSFQITGASGAALIVPSMGASAVLLFAVPHGKLSQPWPLLGGNLLSALIGVACYKLIPDTFLAAGIAVGTAIGAMHLLNCMHPPGGASALIAVVGGPEIYDLGFLYIFNPILTNVIIILVIAVLFNSIFPWRRYPASAMMRFTDQTPANSQNKAFSIDKHYIERAMTDMDLLVDITMEDLQTLIQRSLEYSQDKQLTVQQIRLGRYYTNGKHGPEWSVRRIIDESQSSDPNKDMVIYRIIEGNGAKTADSCTRSDFARWATREVFVNNGK